MTWVEEHAAKPATVHDVARVAGVSAQTVSRLLKGFEGIRPTTRERVESAIEELGYRPNHAARQLRTQKSMRIGAVVHEMFEYGPALLLRGAAARARAAGYALNVVGVDGDDERSVQGAFDAFEEERVAGILAVTLTDDVRKVVEARPVSVPVLIDPAESGANGPAVNHVGAELIADHLLALGHRRVAMVLGPESWTPARQRREGFERAIRRGGGACIRVWPGDWSPSAGLRAARTFDPLDEITAIFAVNDATAIGLITGLRARGIPVPEAVSVVGFDAIPLSEHIEPALTTVQGQFEAQGDAAVMSLLAMVDGRSVDTAPRPQPALLVRASTGSAP